MRKARATTLCNGGGYLPGVEALDWRQRSHDLEDSSFDMLSYSLVG